MGQQVNIITMHDKEGIIHHHQFGESIFYFA
ncbi:MAG: hypothetical protein ACI90V_005003 [Bacillariaceae sp.]|jgi:hypothetical protein